MAKLPLTVDELRSRLHYDPSTGDFTWVSGQRKGNRAGGVSGRARSRFIGIGINRGYYYAHQLAFLWMTGAWPIKYVDHINGDPLDNRWENLRLASNKENVRNARRSRQNTTGFKGTSGYTRRPRARIVVNGKNIHLGYFDTVEDAHAAYRVAARKHHGEFARFE